MARKGAALRIRGKALPLRILTWSYLLWSVAPVLLAITFSFNSGRSISVWQGFSLRWWLGDPSAGESLWYDPGLHAALFQTARIALLATILAVPIGASFAIGLQRWRGRPTTAMNLTVLSVYLLPEIVLGLAFFFLFTLLLRPIFSIGTTAQVIGLVTRQIPIPFLIVRARLLTIGMDYEYAAMDLGSSPLESFRRVLAPLLYPALFASAALVFADCVDDFVIVQYLASGAGSQTLSTSVYSASLGTPAPSINAAGALMFASTVTIAAVGLIVFRVASRLGRTRQTQPAEIG